VELPADLQFSQASLQDYAECARRFHLRYVLRLRWPAEETTRATENERRQRKGATLHRLIRQHVVGVPVEALSRSIRDIDVRRWWESYLDLRPAAHSTMRHPEVTLSTLVGQYSLTARYDLIAVDGDREVMVFDWKTYRKRPQRRWLARRLQTRVYPYVLVRAWDALGEEGSVQPSQVSMSYWFAEFPSTTEVFGYDEEQFRADGKYLQRLVLEIGERTAACVEGELLPRTSDRERCQFCRYRSLCRRGVEPGDVNAAMAELASEELSDFNLDFEQIAEFEMG